MNYQGGRCLPTPKGTFYEKLEDVFLFYTWVIEKSGNVH